MSYADFWGGNILGRGIQGMDKGIHSVGWCKGCLRNLEEIDEVGEVCVGEW